MGSKRGLGDASLTRGPSQRAGFVAALQRVSSESVVEWDVQRVGVNPYNPVRRSSRVEWLALSVASKGLLEPLLVVSVQAWLAAHPEHEGGGPRPADQLAGLVNSGVRGELVGGGGLPDPPPAAAHRVFRDAIASKNATPFPSTSSAASRSAMT